MLGRPRWVAMIAAVTVTSILADGFHEGYAMESPFPRRIKPAELPEGMTWLNTQRPLAWKDLRGKIVLLDFWTYCCINCMHILPELKKLEHAYPQELVVIGIHSAKFETEQDSRNIREAIQRYEIQHPVVNDRQHVVWERFGVHVWPTLLLIDPEGYVVWGTTGEVTFEQLDKVLKAGIQFYDQQKLIRRSPVEWGKPAVPESATPLRFPGKVLADEAGDRLFIADSNHNRIVVARLDGQTIATIGSGPIGRKDGDFHTAQFNHPQGMALKGQTLYVADTENHSLRKIDLESRSVKTIAGLGRQGRELPSLGRLENPRTTALNSPWALWIHGDDLFIAMAGPHQIWRMTLDEKGIGPYAGNGREDIVDGPLLPPEPYELGYASFAQPSGLASDGRWLYVVDSEGSSIRMVPFDRSGKVQTLVGTSRLTRARLFTFGDVDGDARKARLQHPLGIVYYKDQLYVADTYNNKIKAIDPDNGTVHTLAGTGRPGLADEPAQFDEPAGLAAAAGKLFVADTNNHVIRVIDLQTSKVSTLKLTGLKWQEEKIVGSKQ